VSREDALWLARVVLLDPYPTKVFTPLTREELLTCVAALQASGVPHASDRLHASWARHLHEVALHYAREGLP
jgi:hypothetical protein